MTEKQIEQYLRDRIKELGGKAYKFVSPGNDGVPDRLVVLPGGKVLFVELKAPGKKPTPLQEKQMKTLTDLGQDVGVVSSKADADACIEYCEMCIARRGSL